MARSRNNTDPEGAGHPTAGIRFPESFEYGGKRFTLTEGYPLGIYYLAYAGSTAFVQLLLELLLRDRPEISVSLRSAARAEAVKPEVLRLLLEAEERFYHRSDPHGSLVLDIVEQSIQELSPPALLEIVDRLLGTGPVDVPPELPQQTFPEARKTAIALAHGRSTTETVNRWGTWERIA